MPKRCYQNHEKPFSRNAVLCKILLTPNEIQFSCAKSVLFCQQHHQHLHLLLLLGTQCMYLLLHNYYSADSAPVIILWKPAVHLWSAFAIAYRFPWIQLFLLFLSSVLSLVPPCCKNAKVSAQLCLDHFSSGPSVSAIYVSLRFFMVISHKSMAFCLPSSAITFLFVYHLLFGIAIITKIQDILLKNKVLCWLFSTLV